MNFLHPTDLSERKMNAHRYIPDVHRYIEQNRVDEKRPVITHQPGTQFSLRTGGKEIEAYIREKSAGTSFSEKVQYYIELSGKKPSEFYNDAGFDRKLFSALKTGGRNYQPSRKTAIKCCLALKLSLQQAEELLSLAGYSLGMSSVNDLIIRFCMENSIWDIVEVDELLISFGEQPFFHLF